MASRGANIDIKFETVDLEFPPVDHWPGRSDWLYHAHGLLHVVKPDYRTFLLFPGCIMSWLSAMRCNS